MADFPPLPSELRVRQPLSLRLMATGDAQEIFTVVDANRAYLREWLPWVDHSKTVEDAEKHVQTQIELAQKGEGATYVVRVDAVIVGLVSYNSINWRHSNTELGYWLAQSAQGKGIMTDAVRALTASAFEDLALNRVYIRCGTNNRPSCGIPERLGFTREGTLRQDVRLYDTFIDHGIYSMLAQEWQR